MPATVEALAVLMLLVAPGFLCSRLVSTDIPRPFVSQSHQVVLALILSVLIHILILPWTVSLVPEITSFVKQLKNLQANSKVQMNWYVFTWLATVLFVIPVILALLLSKIWKIERIQPVLGWIGLSNVQMTPRAWDWFFLTQMHGCWVVAELEDSTLVGGEYGSGSFVSLSPYTADLFLEKEYYVDEDHNFLDPVPDTIGVWINGSKVKKLHCYRSEEDN